MELKKIIFKGLYDTEAKMLVDWFEEIFDRYEDKIEYTNVIIDGITNDLSFDLSKFDFSTHESYIELTYKGHSHERATISTPDFNEITLG